MTPTPATILGARLYLALARHNLLATYEKHLGTIGGTADEPICVLHPRSLGALVRLARPFHVVLGSSAQSARWIAYDAGRVIESAVGCEPEQAVARALLLALGEEG
jgi:hypothetical protein